MNKWKYVAGLTLFSSVNALANGYDLSFITNGSFDKPVIFVEGYDPDNKNTLDKNENGDRYEQLRYYAANTLRASGRDLVFVNFTNGGAKVEDNAQALVQAIAEVNRRKIDNHPNAVVGYSMGGLVARWALKDMEDRGIDHDTALYVSYDTPHRGANVPISIKYELDYLQDKIKKYLFKNVDRDIIYSPAGREMITWGSDYARFYKSLEHKGYPQKLRRVAFSNGSATGRKVEIPFNFVALDYRFEVYQYKNYYRQPKSLALTSCVYPCNPIGASHLDSAPGSTINAFASLLKGMRDNEAPMGFDLDVYVDNTSQSTHNFIPTVSALDLPNHDYLAPISQNDIDYKSPFDEAYVTSFNLRHDEFHSTAALTSELNLYHTYNAGIPSRSHKQARLSDLTNLSFEWLVGGRYFVEWSPVDGATHYEVYLGSAYGSTFPSSPVITTSNTQTSVTVQGTRKVAVRACNNNSCSHPKVIKLVERSTDLQPF